MVTTLVCFIAYSEGYDPEVIYDVWLPFLQDKGWSPLLSASFLDYECDLRLDSTALTDITLSHLARCETLLLPPEWEQNELARVEKSFCKMNDIPIFEVLNVRQLEEKFPTAKEFTEKYAAVSVRRQLSHCG